MSKSTACGCVPCRALSRTPRCPGDLATAPSLWQVVKACNEGVRKMSRTEQMISIQKKMEFKIKVSPRPHSRCARQPEAGTPRRLFHRPLHSPAWTSCLRAAPLAAGLPLLGASCPRLLAGLEQSDTSNRDSGRDRIQHGIHAYTQYTCTRTGTRCHTDSQCCCFLHLWGPGQAAGRATTSQLLLLGAPGSWGGAEGAMVTLPSLPVGAHHLALPLAAEAG